MGNKKRGQITVFLILAVIIILIGIVFFSYQEFSGTTFEEETFVGPEFAPVKTFVEECIKQSADEGINIIGATGGYIEIQPALLNPRAHLSVIPGLKNPYWWYDGKDAAPKEEFIANQLQNYIREKSAECINNFEGIKDRYGIEERGNLDVKVLLNEEDVSVGTVYPLSVLYRAGNQRKDIDKFFYKAPVRLKRAYELAKAIMSSENSNGFFERRTIDLISMRSEDAVPLNGYEPAVPCKSKSWHYSNIKDEVKGLLDVNLGYVKVEGTDFSTETFVSNPCTLEEYKNRKICENSGQETNTFGSTYLGRHYILDLQQNKEFPKEFSNLKVGFRIADDFDKFEIRPQPQGDILSSNRQKPIDVRHPLLSGIVSNLFCFNQWHFTYDISYPVLASIYDKPTKKTQPYIFNFAFKVNIDHNAPKRESAGSVLLESAVSDKDFCEDVSKGIVTIMTAAESGENTGGIDKADINFICGKFSCNLGKTKFDELNLEDPSAKIIRQLPKCSAAVITASKEDYVEGRQTIVADNKHRSYEIVLKPLKAYPKNYEAPTSFKVVKHELIRPSASAVLKNQNKLDFAPEQNSAEVGGDEKAFVLIKDYNSDFESSVGFPAEKEGSLSLLKSPAKYSLEIYVLKDDAPAGVFKGNWTTEPGEVENSNEIVFHTIGFEPLSSLNQDEKNEELAVFLDNMELYSKKLEESLNKKLPELRQS